ncbi:MAG: DUF308 domain-containing protein [Clostridia bacterium]|nr:DUF308 domain-containing protein [Clostridia bacterium]MBQ3461615.1 DUF308 domain-containing protein [Clostridia bacterium]
MKVLMVILGVLMAILGAACFITPVMTWAGVEFTAITITAIMMIVYGIAGIIKAISDKEYGVNLIFSILSIIFGGVMFIPGMHLALGSIGLYMVAAWFILNGLTTIFMSLNLKREEKNSNGWIWGIVIGIIGILLGIYSFVHPIVIAGAIGILIAFYLIETGFNLIIIGVTSSK